jgi:DNA polymerase III gamma/tau subunit
MSRQAWDILLRTVEAAPPGLTFIFCTTSPEKLRPEALSRVYRFDMSPPSESAVAARLLQAAQACSRSLDEGAAYDIASRARGNVRTALQLLEKVLIHPEADVATILGPGDLGLALVEAGIRRDRTGGMRLLDQAWAQHGSVGEVYADWMHALELVLRYKVDAEVPDNPSVVARIRDVAPAYHETMIAAGMEALAEWARRGGRRGSLAFAWTSYLKAINGPTQVDSFAIGAARNASRKITSADLSTFTL